MNDSRPAASSIRRTSALVMSCGKFVMTPTLSPSVCCIDWSNDADDAKGLNSTGSAPETLPRVPPMSKNTALSCGPSCIVLPSPRTPKQEPGIFLSLPYSATILAQQVIALHTELQRPKPL